MKLLIALLAMPLCGCTAFVRELHTGPYPLTLAQHSRVIGIKASYQGYGLQLGFVSESVTFIPSSTNKLYLPPMDDSFALGQSWTDTSIKESIVTGYEGNPPPARFQHLFHPKQATAQEKLESPKAKDQSSIPMPEPDYAATRRALDDRIAESVKRVPPPVVPQTVTLSDLEYAGLRSAAMGTNPTMAEIHYHFHLEMPPQPPPLPDSK